MVRVALLACALVLGLAVTAAADDCLSTGDPEVNAAGVAYVDLDHDPRRPTGGIFVYEESNGMHGLQRQDEVVDDTCGGKFAADTLLLVL